MLISPAPRKKPRYPLGVQASEWQRGFAWLFSRVRFFATPWTVCSPPGSSVHGDSPGKNTGVGCQSLLQETFPIRGSNPRLPHCRRILYRLSHQGSCVETRDGAKHSMMHRIVPPFQRILWTKMLAWLLLRNPTQWCSIKTLLYFPFLLQEILFICNYCYFVHCLSSAQL